jgi:hypothetical protein
VGESIRMVSSPLGGDKRGVYLLPLGEIREVFED